MTDYSSTVQSYGKYIPWAAVVVFLSGAMVVWARFGAPAVVLWFAFGALSGAILLFWESLRAVLDHNAPGDDETLDGDDRMPSALEAKKRAAMRALKDIEFEHSIHRLSDEDYAALKEKYRTEARHAMEAMDRGLGEFLSRAEELIASGGTSDSDSPKNKRKTRAKDEQAAADVRVEKPTSAESTDATASAICSACEAKNDEDAVFCKKCGARIAGASA